MDLGGQGISGGRKQQPAIYRKMIKIIVAGVIFSPDDVRLFSTCRDRSYSDPSPSPTSVRCSQSETIIKKVLQYLQHTLCHFKVTNCSPDIQQSEEEHPWWQPQRQRACLAEIQTVRNMAFKEKERDIFNFLHSFLHQVHICTCRVDQQSSKT